MAKIIELAKHLTSLLMDKGCNHCEYAETCPKSIYPGRKCYRFSMPELLIQPQDLCTNDDRRETLPPWVVLD
jgi:hypothetical protein